MHNPDATAAGKIMASPQLRAWNQTDSRL